VKEATVVVPRSLTAQTVVPFASAIVDTPRADRYVIDLKGLSYVEPFGMVFASSILRRFVETRRCEQRPEPEFVV
jgi:hypothetical protein